MQWQEKSFILELPNIIPYYSFFLSSFMWQTQAIDAGKLYFLKHIQK